MPQRRHTPEPGTPSPHSPPHPRAAHPRGAKAGVGHGGAGPRWSRLWQPHNPLFWVVLVLNALSTGLAWLVRTHPLPLPLGVLVAVFAVGNAVLGLRLMWGLVKEPGAEGAAGKGGG